MRWARVRYRRSGVVHIDRGGWTECCVAIDANKPAWDSRTSRWEHMPDDTPVTCKRCIAAQAQAAKWPRWAAVLAGAR